MNADERQRCPSVWCSRPNACHHPAAFHLPGFTDEHGYGGYCHNWESEHHQPWCYVDDKCEGGRRGVKMRKHQACSSQTGYLGPQVRPRWQGDSRGRGGSSRHPHGLVGTPHPDPDASL